MGIAEGMGNGIPIKSPTTENAKVRKSAFVLRGWILLFENSNPLINRNEKGLFYSVDHEKISNYFLFGLSK